MYDEAASHLRINRQSLLIWKADRQIIQLKIEQAALENAKASEKRLAAIAAELASLEQCSDELTAAWDGVKARMAEVGRLQQQLEDQRHSLDVAQREGRLEMAAELTYATLPALEQELAAAKDAVAESQLVDEEVTAPHIASVISSWTGIPVDKMLEGEREKLAWRRSLASASLARVRLCRPLPMPFVGHVLALQTRISPWAVF